MENFANFPVALLNISFSNLLIIKNYLVTSDALSNTWSRLKIMATRNTPRLQGFSRLLWRQPLISYCVVAWLFFSAFFIQYKLILQWARNCLVSVKQRPIFVSFPDFCFGEQLCRFFVSMLWFSVQDNSYPGFSELSSSFFLFHELKTKRQQNMWKVTQVYSKFLVIFSGPFLQSPDNFSAPKSNIQIEIKRIRARVLAS